MTKSINEALERFHKNRLEVMRMADLTHDQLEAMIFEYGMRYLEHECQGDTEGVTMMSQTGMYWKWWRNLWQIRDDKLMRDHHHFNRRFYEHWHNVTAIAQHPHRFIYEQAYCNFITTKIQEIHEKI